MKGNLELGRNPLKNSGKYGREMLINLNGNIEKIGKEVSTNWKEKIKRLERNFENCKGNLDNWKENLKNCKGISEIWKRKF